MNVAKLAKIVSKSGKLLFIFESFAVDMHGIGQITLLAIIACKELIRLFKTAVQNEEIILSRHFGYTIYQNGNTAIATEPDLCIEQ